MRFTLNEIKEATGAEVSGEDCLPCEMELDCKAVEGFYEISTDTRTIKKGDLYLPLKGANFDGEDFCDKAIEQGASGCFYTSEDKRCQEAITCHCEGGNGLPTEAIQPIISDTDKKAGLLRFARNDNSDSLHTSNLWLKVPDTLTAYLQLANFARRKINSIVIGVTGSSGKTTTKEMIYSVVSEKFKTHKTFSNHNNEIGFCQTTLTMPYDCEVLIVEMGMRGLGEIELITKYAEPDYAVITNAGSAHIGRLGSLDNIAKAKCEITTALHKTLIAHDNERIKKFANFEGEKVFYSINDVKILEKSKGYSKFLYKENEYELNVEGDYNIENSLSAIEIGLHLGMSYEEIKSGLLKYKPIEKRWEVQNVGGYNIINDSYNANPESMKASVSTFLELYKNSVVILGNMGELGENEVEFHREVGRVLGEKYATKHEKDRRTGGQKVKLVTCHSEENAKHSTWQSQKTKLKMLDCFANDRNDNKNNHSTVQPFNISTLFITVGNLARHIGLELEKSGFNVMHFDNNIETSRYILDNIDVGTTIFLKASRSMKFEEIIDELKKETEK